MSYVPTIAGLRWLAALPLLAGCGDRGAPEGPSPAPIPERSEGCGSCHAEAHARWSGSHHALAMTIADPALAPPPLEGPDGPVAPDVAWVIGVEPLRQVVVAGEGGRHQVSQVAWDPVSAEWFDVFADDRDPGEWGHWTGRGMTWDSMCAACHTTGLDVVYDVRSDTFTTTFDELGVGCVACHAPHAPGERPPPVAEDTCGSCHARGASLTGDFVPGEAWLDHYLPALPDETDTWYADGGVRDELFEWTAFRASKMHGQGVRCGDCHDPHSGRLVRTGDDLCLGCHAQQPAFALHDHHPVGAVACVDCHMPTTTYMQRHPRRDHGLRIPDPELAAEIGAPSPCAACHPGGRPAPAAWWPGLADRPHRAWARALASARRGDGPELVLASIPGAPGPWRGALLGVLGPWLGDPRVDQALSAAAGDADPWVRWAAARSLGAAPAPVGDRALPGLLVDPVRAVRVQAALGLRHQLTPDDPRAADLRAWLDRDLHQPQARAVLAQWFAGHGDLRRAEELLRPAVAWDPTGTGARVALAVVLARQQRPTEARALLEEGVRRAPEDADLRFRLALARLAEGDRAGGAADLQATVALDPSHARAWYNLGLLRDQAGDLAGALEALGRADAAQPSPPDALWALATIRARSGDVPLARRLASEVLARDPGHREARAWLARLPEER